jgi:hypothetical protein
VPQPTVPPKKHITTNKSHLKHSDIVVEVTLAAVIAIASSSEAVIVVAVVLSSSIVLVVTTSTTSSQDLVWNFIPSFPVSEYVSSLSNYLQGSKRYNSSDRYSNTTFSSCPLPPALALSNYHILSTSLPSFHSSTNTFPNVSKFSHFPPLLRPQHTL